MTEQEIKKAATLILEQSEENLILKYKTKSIFLTELTTFVSSGLMYVKSIIYDYDSSINSIINFKQNGRVNFFLRPSAPNMPLEGQLPVNDGVSVSPYYASLSGIINSNQNGSMHNLGFCDTIEFVYSSAYITYIEITVK